MLAGCTKLYGSPAKRKCALTESDLLLIIRSAPHLPSHDNLLFNAIVLVGWHCLLRLGKLIDHDSANLFLPMHKANRFFEGSTVIFKKWLSTLNPVHFFKIYLHSCNSHYPHLPQLWLHSNSHVPTQSWFINHICCLFPSNEIAGHSLWSGGATVLTLAGTLLHQIQGTSWWSSNAFLIYLWKNPLLIQGSLTGHSAFNGQQNDHWSNFTTSHLSSSFVTIFSFTVTLLVSVCVTIKMAFTCHPHYIKLCLISQCLIHVFHQTNCDQCGELLLHAAWFAFLQCWMFWKQL